jgi:hypothetical protein
MPIEKTAQEQVADKLYPTNPAKILNTIHFLKRRYFKDFIPSSPERVLVSAGYVGLGVGTAATFSSVTASAAKGSLITFTGTATYRLTRGATGTVMPALGLVAQINIGRLDTGYVSFQIRSSATEINADGTFTFSIPGSETQKMAAGTHTVYIDAFSPIGSVRLGASGMQNDVRTFVITES